MTRIAKFSIRTGVMFGVLTGLAIAQETPAPPTTTPASPDSPTTNRGWRRITDPAPNPQPMPAPNTSASANTTPDETPAPQAEPRRPDPPPPSASGDPNGGYQGLDQYGNRRTRPAGGPQASSRPLPPAPTVPPQITVRQGTFLTVRVNQVLSSDQNQQGDAFSATLVKPLIVDGVVVAQRGQTIAGRVVEAKKAGRVQGVSHLGIQLTELTLVDGQQLPVQTALITRAGDTSVGRDVGAIAGTTATGAAIGAAVDWGRGAGIGAGAGAAVGLIGVLLTRGHPTIIYPESVLTFRIEQPISFSTERAPYAFRFVEPGDYDRPQDARLQVRRAPSMYPGSTYYAGPGYYPYPYYYSPYWFGPGFGFYYGSFGWGRGYYGRGYYGGGGFYGRGGGRRR